MEEFESSTDTWNREWKSSRQVRSLESVMKQFERCSDTWDREWKSSSEVRSLESGMEDFEQSSDAWNREWKSSRQVRGLESRMEKFEPCSRLGIGKGGVRAKFRRSIVVQPLRHSCGSQTATRTHGNGACPLRYLY